MNIRPAAVAGLFYPASPSETERLVGSFISGIPRAGPVPKALVVPHAGYIYSGPTAGVGYAQLADADIDRVVLFGPAHRVPFAGLAVPDADGFATPMGIVPLDQLGLARALQHPAVVQLPVAHAMEHSLEVQLPFLQYQLKTDFRLVPLVIGDAEPEDVAAVMDSLWGDGSTLVLVSSDLSHYLPYRDAQAVDHGTIRQILALEGDIRHEQACGATGINGLIRVARKRGMRARLLDYRNSGDTAGDKEQVVGYASIAFDEVGT